MEAVFEFVKSEEILKGLACIMFGVPVFGARQARPARLFHTLLSGILVLFIWFSCSFQLYCVKTYWRSSDYTPQIPIETLLLIIPLNISQTVSFTLMVWYFYNPCNDFSHSKTRLVPHFEYMPEGYQIDVGPEGNDWKHANILLFFGVVGVALVLYVSFGLNVYFDFVGIHDFTANIHDWRRALYYGSCAVIYWGFFSVVVACCIFYICCKDIMQHIEHTETIIVKKARNYLMARQYHDCLLSYAENVMKSMKLWFGIHTLLFMFIIVSVSFEWVTAFSGKKHYNDIAIVVLSQTVGSFFIAFNFAFPILAASRVTAKFESMYRNINRRWCPDELPQVEVLMDYCRRCEAGFTLFGVKLTAQLALISLLSCFVGFFKLYKKVE
ncbi:uncharacterized protein LOC110246263 [Exaiptasia diaphana]|uniref:Uncharacterized protein n=1 Tax=Exaiptasia diaphana TaxID=2652724 RepID=A0A913XPQ8_EXADI|nr:uncharacterized protein LOC110246263 [Exaiptasia diaphana]